MTQRRHAWIAVALLLAACGGSPDAASEGAAEMALDTAIKPLEREPLTEADLVGLELADLAIELPWTRNAVTREPMPAQASGILLGWETDGHDGFDRVSFTFDEIAPLAAYRIRIVDGSEEVRCAEADDGEEIDPAPLPGDRVLLIHLDPAREPDEGSTLRTGFRNLGLARMERAGLACIGRDNIAWAAALAEGTDVRVLEMRNPQRVVVDIR